MRSLFSRLRRRRPIPNPSAQGVPNVETLRTIEATCNDEQCHVEHSGELTAQTQGGAQEEARRTEVLLEEARQIMAQVVRAEEAVSKVKEEVGAIASAAREDVAKLSRDILELRVQLRNTKEVAGGQGTPQHDEEAEEGQRPSDGDDPTTVNEIRTAIAINDESTQEQVQTGDAGHTSLRRELEGAFYEYVFNITPARLLDIRDPSQPRLIGREEVYSILKWKLDQVPSEWMEQNIEKAMVLKGNTSLVEARRHLVNALISKLVDYAILSHRWLPVGEVKFQDLTGHDATPRDGLGWKKLLQFCRTAHSFGCTLAWSDTCCIDKSSSAELDEAIRSMFQWYRHAQICIVYLSETSGLHDLEKDVWFTRGWTLQELIAPQRLKFFGRDWLPLSAVENDKEDLQIAELVKKVTNISTDALMQFQPGTRNIVARMLWAANRRTTKVEDRAYSLIGIFDVTMPISYGEGENAFRRLMEAIYQSYVHYEMFMWEGPCSRHPTTNALPSSPECYLPYDDDDRRFKVSRSRSILSFWEGPTVERVRPRAGDTSFTLTNHGLRIRCLVIPSTLLSSERVKDDLWKWTLHPEVASLQQNDSGEPVPVIDVTVFVDHGTQSRIGRLPYDLALGILDFEHVRGDTETEGGLMDGWEHFGWLLARSSEQPRHGPLRSYFKLMTYNIVKIGVGRRDNWHLGRTVLRGSLQTLYL